MKHHTITLLAGFFILAGVDSIMAIEEAEYTVVKKDGRFEIRDYASHILAETLVEGSLEKAGDQAFQPLFRYISGQNRTQAGIAMTAPVSQERAPEKIAMTAPVSQEHVGEQWRVSFMMPASFTMETIPEPTDPSVTLREIPARRMAAVRYKGFWSEKNYQRNLALLRQWMEDHRFVSAGDPVWARYNPPFMPWFLRRNEILIPVMKPTP
jgi:hypothetical protein